MCNYLLNTTYRNIYKSLGDSEFMENDNNKLERDLKRYLIIANHYKENPGRVRENRDYLHYLSRLLKYTDVQGYGKLGARVRLLLNNDFKKRMTIANFLNTKKILEEISNSKPAKSEKGEL